VNRYIDARDPLRVSRAFLQTIWCNEPQFA
jgi:hypothetical protein